MDLTAYRESCDRTVADIARIMGVTEGTVRRWEKTGDPKISLSQMPIFLALYGLEVDIEKAKEEVKQACPTLEQLIIEAERKETWSPKWKRFSMVVPTYREFKPNTAPMLLELMKGYPLIAASIINESPTIRLIYATIEILIKLRLVKPDDRLPIILGKVFIAGCMETHGTYGVMIDDEVEVA
jgi:transcriptional regulator with XRE-family HTH domain